MVKQCLHGVVGQFVPHQKIGTGCFELAALTHAKETKDFNKKKSDDIYHV